LSQLSVRQINVDNYFYFLGGADGKSAVKNAEVTIGHRGRL
jgi:hypothetical protein